MKSKHALFLLLFMSLIFSHQPRLVMGIQNSNLSPITVPDPNISKAYYGELSGKPDYYEIDSQAPFDLYVNILVPDVPGYNSSRFSVIVLDQSGKQMILLNGTNSTWKPFHEPFGNDDYLMGPEARMNATPGKYSIIVFNSNNSGRYSLATGEDESFPPMEILNAMILVPQLKTRFFNHSFLEAYGVWIAFVVGVLILGIALIQVKKLLAKRRTKPKNR
jgi:hypothetical protein